MYKIAVIGDRDSIYGFATLGLDVYPAETVEAGIERMEDFFRRIGMPTTLPELGIDESRLTEMAEKAVLNGPLGHFYPMDAKQVEDMYRLAL